jgi:cellulose synthase (UDP-forming)
VIKIGSAEILAALWPTLALLGGSIVAMAALNRSAPATRMGVMAISVTLLLRYYFWRASSTLPPVGLSLDFVVGALFLFVETTGLVAAILCFFYLSGSRPRTPDVERNKPWLEALPVKPLIDVLICTYNEEEAILERTIIGATGMDYPNYRVWVLDDGGRPWLQAMCEKLDCGYIARPDNAHAKAGNINHALGQIAELPNPPQFVSILDADFVPMPDFLSRAMTLFRDERIGIVQTPQHFINPDPIQTNLLAAQVWPDEQRFFFDVVMPAKDAWSAAFCCGTSSIVRFEPLIRIGGLPTDSVTEDYLLTLRMKEAGYTTAYLNEALTLGLAPEGLKEYISQRSRWCLGFMQIMRGRSGPFSPSSNLTFIDRLSLIDSFLMWAAVYPSKLVGVIVPILYLVFNIRSVNADLHDVAVYFLPFFVWHTVAMSWLTRGRVMPVMSDVCQLIAAPQVLKAVIVGLLKPQGHKFKVTAKGGDRNRRFVEWPLFRFYSVLLALTILSIGFAFHLNARGDGIEFGALALIWSWYNLVILTIVCFVCIEQPRRRKAERFETNELVALISDGQEHLRQLIDISISGARVAGLAPVTKGGATTCRIRNCTVEVKIIRAGADSFAISFDGSLAMRFAMIRHFYSSQYVKAFEKVNAASVGKAVAQRLLR